ncbi:hypothetical protein Ancab_036248 [Ancistrocladus abbreviatus]
MAMMREKTGSKNNMREILGLCLVLSIFLNVQLIGVNRKLFYELGWSRRAAEEAEAVASISCSGHGRAFLDGLPVEGKPVCECFACYTGPTCSVLSLDGCPADADSGNPIFLEPFWRKHASSSAVLVAGWHRMGYAFEDQTSISKELEKYIRKVHAIAGNAVTDGKYILFGAGSTQLLNAAVHALSYHFNTSGPARVVASIPFYPVYQKQTDYFSSENFKFAGDTSLWKDNISNSEDSRSSTFIEFVTSPNNPDGQLKQSVLGGTAEKWTVKTIHDHAYYWPHFTAIPAPADEDHMIFTLSKLTGHAGSRFGWALVKDEELYNRMVEYVTLNVLGISHDSQLRALQLLKAITDGRGNEFFEFGYTTMRDRWEKLSRALSSSRRFSIQEIPPLFCTFFQQVRGPSPAYAWFKCNREEDNDCYGVLRAAGIISRNGSMFGNPDGRYVRLSLIKSQDDFDLLLQRIQTLLSHEDDDNHPKTICSRELIASSANRSLRSTNIH